MVKAINRWDIESSRGINYRSFESIFRREQIIQIIFVVIIWSASKMCGQSSSSSSPSTSIWTGWSAVVTQLSVNFGLCGLLQILPRWRFCLKNCKSHYSKYHNSDFPLKRSQYRRWVLTATANWWWKRVASFSSRILSTRTSDLTLRSKNSQMTKEIEMARVISNAHESILCFTGKKQKLNLNRSK